MAATRLIALHINKGKTIAQTLADRTDYAENEKKTEGGRYISSYECDARTADEEFLLSKRQYEQITGRRQFGNDGWPSLGLPCLQALIPHPKILRQLLGGSFGGEVEQLAHKVDHIPVLLTAEAVEPLIHFHAGCSVIMERTAGHAVPLDLDPVMLRCGYRWYSVLDRFK